MKSNKFIKTVIFLLLAITGITSCKNIYNCENINKNNVDGRTLYKICKYITDNKQLSEPANPCEWKISEKKSDMLNGKEIYRIKMTCCFMGDQIIIDKKSNEIIGYLPSDK
jgi:hypothetical protein